MVKITSELMTSLSGCSREELSTLVEQDGYDYLNCMKDYIPSFEHMKEKFSILAYLILEDRMYAYNPDVQELYRRLLAIQDAAQEITDALKGIITHADVLTEARLQELSVHE